MDYKGHFLDKSGLVGVSSYAVGDAVKDWILEIAEKMEKQDCNVLKFEMLNKDGDIVPYKFYRRGMSGNIESDFYDRVPDHFEERGTFTTFCPVYDNGLERSGSMVVADLAESKCAIVNNLQDYGDALKYFAGSERNVVQLHDDDHLSVLDAVKLAEKKSNLILVHSSEEFPFVDKHVARENGSFVPFEESMDKDMPLEVKFGDKKPGMNFEK